MNRFKFFLFFSAASVFFIAPVYAADFDSEIENGLFKRNAIETEHFHLEFSDLILNQTDSDGDDISDIIENVAESAEHAWSVIIDDMGYEEPQDMSAGKVMLILDDNYEYLYSGTLGVTSLLSNGNPYIAVDPWASEEILQVTTGHEFYHAVQFGYDPNFAYTYQGINWAEASATWMEDLLFDSVNDYALYIPDFLEYPDYSIFASIVPTGTLFEYGMNIWPRFLYEYYNEFTIQEIWETYFDSSVDYESDLKVYEAVKEVIEEEGETLPEIYHEFALWNLSLEEYEEAELYPSVFQISDVGYGEYTLIEEAYAPALYGTNYLYFDGSSHGEDFYFHMIKTEGVSYKISLVPYNNGDYEIEEAVSTEIDMDDEMDTYLRLENADTFDGVIAVVSCLELEFDDGYNWEVFDEGYLYYYLASYEDEEDTFLEMMGAEDEEVVVEEETEEKEGEEVEAGDGLEEDTLMLSLILYDEESATFSWNRLNDESIASYELRYEAESSGDEGTKEIENAYTTGAAVEDLEEGETYTFQLFALDDEGDEVGDPSGAITVTLAEWIFEDISYQHEYYNSVAALVEEGIFQGYSDGTFRPNDEINRAELLKILVEGRDIDVNESTYKNCFPDVGEEWYAKYVCYAKAKGWVSGYPDGTFKPSNSVNKVEALKILFNVYEAGLHEGAKVAKLNYTDLDVNAWYAIYVWKASALGILEEAFGGAFNPELERSRGEMAEELYRYLIVTEQLKVE